MTLYKSFFIFIVSVFLGSPASFATQTGPESVFSEVWTNHPLQKDDGPDIVDLHKRAISGGYQNNLQVRMISNIKDSFKEFGFTQGRSSYLKERCSISICEVVLIFNREIKNSEIQKKSDTFNSAAQHAAKKVKGESIVVVTGGENDSSSLALLAYIGDVR